MFDNREIITTKLLKECNQKKNKGRERNKERGKVDHEIKIENLRGKQLVLKAHCDSDVAWEKMIRKSTSVYVFYLNDALLDREGKKQDIVDFAVLKLNSVH